MVRIKIYCRVFLLKTEQFEETRSVRVRIHLRTWQLPSTITVEAKSDGLYCVILSSCGKRVNFFNIVHQ